MTFYYDPENDELVGNLMFADEYGLARVEDDSLVIDVEQIMENGRGLSKLEEIRDAAQDAIDAHEGE